MKLFVWHKDQNLNYRFRGVLHSALIEFSYGARPGRFSSDICDFCELFLKATERRGGYRNGQVIRNPLSERDRWKVKFFRLKYSKILSEYAAQGGDGIQFRAMPITPISNVLDLLEKEKWTISKRNNEVLLT